MKKILTMLSTGLLALGLASTAGAALQSRLGGLAFYDTQLDITWAANSSINGTGNWVNQNTWAAGLTIGGVGGWRLPSMDVNGDGTIINCSGGGVIGCSDNEMGFLFWEEGITAATPGVFSNVHTSFYWSGTEFDPLNGWDFAFGTGIQLPEGKGNSLQAWAVRSGDVSAVPVPAAVWLFSSALIGLLGVAKRRN